MKSNSIISNGSWDASQQLLTTAANAVITLLLVTAISTAEYGIYSYAIALSSIGMSVMTAGLSGLAVKKLVEDRANNGLIVSSLLVAREMFALAGYALVALVSLSSGDFPTIMATLIAATSLFGRGLEAPEMWYLSHLRSRRVAVVRSLVSVALLALRLLILAAAPSVWLFLALFALEPLIVGLWITWRYVREQDSPGLVLKDLRRAPALVRESLPLMLSGLANQVNLKGDILVLQSLQGSVAVAVYSLAARISELAHFIPVAFMNSMLPNIIKMRQQYGGSSQEYKSSLYRSYVLAFWSGIGIAGLVSALGLFIIPIFFGDAYRASAQILALHSAATPFVFMAAVYSKWIIAEGVLWVSLLRHGAGACLNIALCFLLIPPFGGMGAAAATVASYALASYLSCFIGHVTRSQGLLMTRAMLAPIIYLGGSVQRFYYATRQYARRIMNNILKRFRHIAGKTRNQWYRRPRIAIVSSAIAREHRATRAGVKAYKSSQNGGQHTFLLRRNIHMIEKGLTMQPRRDTYAVDYIMNTVDALVSMMSDPSNRLDGAEEMWMLDVLTQYFSATQSSSHPHIARARSVFSCINRTPDIEQQSGPHLHAISSERISIEDLQNMAKNRRSVRWYQDQTVDREVVDKAIQVALESPTACNRQPYRFEIYDDAESISRVASIAMGTAGYSHQIVGLIVVVGRLSAFFDARDRHLIYIDASLATMSLIYGLESQGVASCVINWPDIAERDLKMRQTLGLAADERVVMLLAYGYPSDSGLVPFSQKGPLSDIRKFKSLSR